LLVSTFRLLAWRPFAGYRLWPDAEFRNFHRFAESGQLRTSRDLSATVTTGRPAP